MLSIISIAVIAFAASFLCVSTGGAGLITTPALIFLGLSPQQAIATDLLSMLGTTAGGFARFRRQGLINYRLGLFLACLAALGCWIGSIALVQVPSDVMRRIKGIFLLILVAIILGKREMGVKAEAGSKGRKTLGYLGFVLVGVWGSFFGGGFNVLATYIAISLFGLTFLHSAGTLTLVNLSIGVVSTTLYAYAGMIHWELGFSALVGKYTGAYVGAGFAEKMGNRWVKGIFAGTVVISSYSLLFG